MTTPYQSFPNSFRRDLRAVPTLTIDAASTRDIDDAIAVLPAPADGGPSQARKRNR